MAEANYRPQAPSDGLGGILLSDAELADPTRLANEALAYAIRFGEEDDECIFNLGCSDYTGNRAFVWTVEAARQIASGALGATTAPKLLRMALAELERVRTHYVTPR